MHITGIALALLDIDAEHTEQFNRWYDFDHLPEHVAKADVVAGRRYVATEGFASLPDVHPSPATGGFPPYATTYCFGGPLDFLSEQAKAGWREKDREIVRAGRFWLDGRPVHATWWRLTAATTRASMSLAEEAVPHLPHTGMVLLLGRARSAEDREAAKAWWERSQLPLLLGLSGGMAVLALDPAGDGDPATFLHLLLCDQPVRDVMAELSRARGYQRLTGAYPAHRGEYEELALLPYERIVPLDYSFTPLTPTPPEAG